MSQHNLPPQLTNFVGRTQEITEIVSHLNDEDCRLLTIIGSGGIGKTRLALAIAETQISNFADGVWFVRLQSITSSDWIVPTIAEAIGFSFKGADEPRKQLLNYLNNKNMLLVLDNFEQLLDEQVLDLLTDILKATSSIKLLVTSREALKLQEEWRYILRGLTIPSEDMQGSNDLDVYESTRLFVSRVHKINPHLNLENVYECIAHLCRLVDGLPLAIEMASSWIDTLSCQEIIMRVERGKLDTRLRNVPERHRSLSVIFEQSWELLTEEGRDIFSKLSVFADDFSKEAAVLVAKATLPTLATLVDKSLLQLETIGRYRIHELVRQFGMQKLTENPQKQSATLNAHSEYYMAFLNTRKGSFRAQESSKIISELGIEIDNIRLAWDRAIVDDKTDIIRETVWCLAEFYEIQNWYREGAYVLGATAEALYTDSPTGSSGIALGLALVGRGNLLHYLGEMDQAKVLIRDGIIILKHLKAFSELAHALSLLGRLTWMVGDFGIAKQAYYDSIALAQETADIVTLGFGYLNLSMIAVIEGNFEESSQLKQQSLSNFQQINHRLGIGIILCIKGEELYLLGHYEQAKEQVLRAIEIFKELDNRWHLSNCYENLGHIISAIGDYPDAIQHLHIAMNLAKEINDPRRITYCHVNLADVLYAHGRVDEANQHYLDGLTLAQDAHQCLQEAWSLRGLGAIAIHNTDYELAKQHLSDSLALCRKMGWKVGIVKALNLLGNVTSITRQLDSAREYFLEALDIANQISASPIILESLSHLAVMLIDYGDIKSAVQIFPVCINHVASHEDTRRQADHLLNQLKTRLPADVFFRLKDSEQVNDLSAVVERWRVQIQYIAQLTTIEPLLDQLTRTERKILILMDSDLSYPEIAQLQHVSINTIKTHRKNIYQKLDVNSRLQAVERAKSLRLL